MEQGSGRDSLILILILVLLHLFCRAWQPRPRAYKLVVIKPGKRSALVGPVGLVGPPAFEHVIATGVLITSVIPFHFSSIESLQLN